MLGIWAAKIYFSKSHIQRYALPMLIALLPVSFIYEVNALPDPVTALALFCAIICILRNSLLSAMFSAWPLRAIGISSFSIYLIHEPVMRVLQYRIRASILESVFAALAVGFTFWFVVERPISQTALRGRLQAFFLPAFERATQFLSIPQKSVVRRGGSSR
jgi:peptidoglycan/LPS O-acetylase OafA/YrhL